MTSIVISAIVTAVLLLYPLWRIFSRAGLPAPLSLLVIVPLGPLIVTLILAFARWPKVAPRQS